MPSIGSKETRRRCCRRCSGLAPGTQVLLPRAGLPDVRRRARGWPAASRSPTDDPTAARPVRRRAGVAQLAVQPDRRGAVRASGCGAVVDWGREHGVLVASDECYLELGWDAEPVSACCTRRCPAGRADGRAGACTRCPSAATWPATAPASPPVTPTAVAAIVEARKHIGLLVPGAGAGRRWSRRSATTTTSPSSGRATPPAATVLLPAVRAAGFTVEHSEAGLYLWCTRGEACWDTVGALADVGVLVGARRVLRRGRRAARPVRADRDRRARRGRRRAARTRWPEPAGGACAGRPAVGRPACGGPPGPRRLAGMTDSPISPSSTSSGSAATSSPPTTRTPASAVVAAVDQLDAGEARVARVVGDEVVVDERAKRAILLAFKVLPMAAGRQRRLPRARPRAAQDHASTASGWWPARSPAGARTSSRGWC